MDSSVLARLELMLERDAEPLRGFVREADNRDWRAFSGWLGLARELERAAANPAPEPGTSPPPERREAPPES